MEYQSSELNSDKEMGSLLNARKKKYQNYYPKPSLVPPLDKPIQLKSQTNQYKGTFPKLNTIESKIISGRDLTTSKSIQLIKN